MPEHTPLAQGFWARSEAERDAVLDHEATVLLHSTAPRRLIFDGRVTALVMRDGSVLYDNAVVFPSLAEFVVLDLGVRWSTVRVYHAQRGWELLSAEVAERDIRGHDGKGVYQSVVYYLFIGPVADASSSDAGGACREVEATLRQGGWTILREEVGPEWLALQTKRGY
jgi:hypothetical protein